jgi:hypothetical protein
MARQVGGVRVDSMVSQMVRFPSSMILPEPRQTFTVRSMTWVIDANGVEEIVEAVQNHPAPIMPTSSTTSLISAPHRWVRRSISNDDLSTSIDRVTNCLAECQFLMDSS